MATLREFLESGRYLPKPLRDFHDQEQVFNLIHKQTKPDGMTWIAAHIYVIDKFLWFMARHGYTLQRSRQPIAFASLSDTLRQEWEESVKESAEMVAKMKQKKETGEDRGK